jgi:hypothetical protein
MPSVWIKTQSRDKAERQSDLSTAYIGPTVCHLGHRRVLFADNSLFYRTLSLKWDIGTFVGYTLRSIYYEQGLDGWLPLLAEATHFSILHSVQTGSGAHPASYPMGTMGSLAGGESSIDMKLTIHHHLMPRSRMVELYFHTPYTFIA